MEEIKSCPFCGADAEIILTDEGFYTIGCFTNACICNILGGNKTLYRSEERAIFHWNRRADDGHKNED